MDEENLDEVNIVVTQDAWDDDDDIEIEVHKKYFDRDLDEDLEDIIIIYDHELNELTRITGYISEGNFLKIENSIVYVVDYSKTINYDYSVDSSVVYNVRDVITSSSNSPLRVNNDRLSASSKLSRKNAIISVKYVLPENANTGELILSSLKGQELKRVKVGKQSNYVNISTNDLPKGMCVYKLETSEGIVYSNKLIIH